MRVRVTEPLNYFKEPWYIEWLMREVSVAFKDIGDIEKAKKFALSKIKKASDDGLDIGTRVDELIKTDTAPSQKDSIEVVTAWNAYGKWRAIYQPKSIIIGTRQYATINGAEVTGEPDLFVDDVLVDVKCASKISQNYWVQVNMYRVLPHYPMAPILHKSKVGILRLDKITGSYEYVVKDYDPNLVNVWLGLLRAYLYYKGVDSGGDELREVGSVEKVA